MRDPKEEIALRSEFRRLVARLGVVLAMLATASTFLVATAPSALADTCVTPSHVYFIQVDPLTGSTLQMFIGPYNDDIYTADTVPTGTFRRLLTYAQLGGNGIAPGTSINWIMINVDTGQDAGVNPQPPNTAHSNCVVNQSPPTYQVTAPVGTYNLHAIYTGGNTGVLYFNKWIMRMIITD